MFIQEKLGWMLRDWLLKLPGEVRETVEKYPPGNYRVKAGAPYSITAPGCVVQVVDYAGAGDVDVVILKATQEADAEHRAKLASFGRPYTPIEGLSATIAAEYLELVEVAPGIKEAWKP